MSECDREASIMKRPMLIKGCCAMGKRREKSVFERYRLISDHNIKMDPKGIGYQNGYCILVA